jgi:two-component system, response regulator PdtaR
MEKPAIFIVEDESIVANDIRETLLSLGYDVKGIAKSGETAVEMVRKTRPDLVLMDIHLAGKMDGVEAAGTIHALCNIPVIYLTAYADKPLLERAKVTEPYGYVLKPYDERELHSVIEMALYKHRIAREIKKRDDVLFAVSSAVEWLLRVTHADITGGSPAREFNPSDVGDILEPIGLALQASSIGIFQIPAGTGPAGTFRMKYEWTGAGTPPNLYKAELRETSFSSAGIANWEEQLRKGDVIAALLRTSTDPEKKFLSLLGCESAVIVPVFIHDTLWGFIGFFNATEQERSVDEIEALRITANLLGAAMGYR